MVALHDAVVIAVDDEPQMREMLSLILGSYVHEVIVASSVEEAMTLMECVEPSLIVADICMPGKDGYELIRRVRAKGKHRTTPAVALSACSEDGCQDAALAAGYDMFLRKPLDILHFLPVLEALLHD